MSEFKGTKGPWECVDMDDDSISEISATMVVCGDVVLAVVGPTPDSSLSEDENNAHLIAAAPDLLGALQFAITEIEARVVTEGDALMTNKVLRQARTAIAKALGETK